MVPGTDVPAEAAFSSPTPLACFPAPRPCPLTLGSREGTASGPRHLGGVGCLYTPDTPPSMWGPDPPVHGDLGRALEMTFSPTPQLVALPPEVDGGLPGGGSQVRAIPSPRSIRIILFNEPLLTPRCVGNFCQPWMKFRDLFLLLNGVLVLPVKCCHCLLVHE